MSEVKDVSEKYAHLAGKWVVTKMQTIIQDETK